MAYDNIFEKVQALLREFAKLLMVLTFFFYVQMPFYVKKKKCLGIHMGVHTILCKKKKFRNTWGWGGAFEKLNI